LSERDENCVRTPSIVAEAMSKSLPESRASSSGCTSSAGDNVDAVTDAQEDNLPADDVDDSGTDQDVPADDSAAEQPLPAEDLAADGRQEDLQPEDGGDQQVPVVDDTAVEQPDGVGQDDVEEVNEDLTENDKEAAEQVFVQIFDITKIMTIMVSLLVHIKYSL